MQPALSPRGGPAGQEGGGTPLLTTAPWEFLLGTRRDRASYRLEQQGRPAQPRVRAKHSSGWRRRALGVGRGSRGQTYSMSGRAGLRVSLPGLRRAATFSRWRSWASVSPTVPILWGTVEITWMVGGRCSEWCQARTAGPCRMGCNVIQAKPIHLKGRQTCQMHAGGPGQEAGNSQNNADLQLHPDAWSKQSQWKLLLTSPEIPM